jgi:hypothetical protein
MKTSATLRALELVRQGALAADAARATGIDRSTLRRAMRAEGMAPRPALCGMHLRAAKEQGLLQAPPPAPKRTERGRGRSAAVERALQLMQEGMTAAAAARAAGCTPGAVYRACARL